VELRSRPLLVLVAVGLLSIAGTTAAAQTHAATPHTSHTASRQASDAGTSKPSTTSGAAITTSAAATTTTLPGTPVDIEHGGTVTIAVPSLPTNLNPSVPAGANRVTAMVTAQIWPSVFTVNNQQTPVLNSSFIESAYLTSVVPQTIVYTIAPHATWSDGTPITAADFIYLWHEQLAYGPELPTNDPVAGYQDIKSITGTNNGRTVTVVFSQPYSSWSSLFANLVPAEVAHRSGFVNGFAVADASNWISGGPFVVAAFVPGQEIRLDRNPRYFGTQPQISSIVFKVAAGDRAVLSGLHDGSLDVGMVTPGAAADSLVTASAGELVQSEALAPYAWQIGFNLARPTFASTAVRRAVGLAIDRNEIVADTASLEAPGTPADSNRVYLSGAPDSQGNGSSYKYADDAEADARLISLGYAVDPVTGAVTTPTGAPFVLTLVGPSGVPTASAIEALLQSQLLAAGITLHVTNVAESKLLAQVLPSGRYEMALVPYLVPPYPGETAVQYTDPVGPTPLDVVAASTPDVSSTTLPGALPGKVSSSNVEPGSVSAGGVTRDVLGFGDPEVNVLYTQASEELDPPTQAQLYNQIDETLWRDLPTIPLFQQPVAVVQRSDLLNVTADDTWAGPLWDAENWVINLAPPVTTTTVP